MQSIIIFALGILAMYGVSSATVVSSMLQVEYILYPILQARSFVKLGFIGHPQNQFPTIIPRFVLTWSIIFRYPCNVCCPSAIVSQFYIAGEVYTISCNIDLGLPASYTVVHHLWYVIFILQVEYMLYLILNCKECCEIGVCWSEVTKQSPSSHVN